MISRTSSRNFLVCFAVLFGLFLGSLHPALLYGQVAGAALAGVVSDQTGRPLPGASISIKNITTGVTRELKTDANGFYTAPNLLPGSYEATTTAPGFKTALEKGITLTVGATQTLNVTMAVGQVSEKVEVSDVAPDVDTNSSTVSGNVDAVTVRELPLNGRDWTTLATLQAGVDTVPVQQPNQGSAPKGNRGYGNQMTISGGRPQQNNYRLDGISINDYSNGAPGSVAGLNLGVDAIAEFSVLTTNYSAEYGRTSGGVINAITKSGTNSFHGTGFEFARNSVLDARNYFDTLAGVPPFSRNQFGAFVGGPIKKDKTFIFGGYEGLRQTLTGTTPITIPSATAQLGQLCNAPTGSLPGCSTYTPYDLTSNGVGRYLKFWPGPKSGDTVLCPFTSCVPGTGDTATTSIRSASTAREDFFTLRADHHISQNDGLFATYLFDDATTTAPDPLNTWLAGNKSRRQAVIIEETHIFSPTVTNSVRIGFSRVTAIVNSAISGINPAATDKTLGIYTANPQYAPQINVGGIQGAGGGLGADPTYHYHWNSYQLYDDASWTRGLHSLRIGFALERMQDNVLADLQPTGLIGFSGLQNFFQNVPTTAIGTIPGQLTGRGIRQTLLAGYVQDDWRVRPRFTMNLGLRYEMTTVPTEVNGKLSNIRTMTSPQIFTGDPYFKNPTLKNFEPHVGLAWDPFGDGKTSVRSAFGLFDVLPIPAAFSLAIDQSAPFYKFFATGGSGTSCALAGAIFPVCAGDPNNNPNVPLTTLQSAYIQYDPHRNYVMIWSLNVQRQLTNNTSLMMGYVGNRGVHMLNREDDINSVIPTQTAQGLLMPVNPGAAPPCTEATLNVVGGGSCKVNPGLGDIRGIYWTGDSVYNAFETEVKTRIGSHLNLQGTYTFGKAIDSGSATVIGDPFQTSISSPYFFCKKCRRGLSDFNISQSMSVHMLWTLPSMSNLGEIGSRVLGGWELGTIITAQTGVPFTPTITGDVLGLGSADPWAFPSRVPGCNPINHNFKKNGGSYYNTGCFQIPLQGAIPDAQCNKVLEPGATEAQPVWGCYNLFGNVKRNSLVGPNLVNVDFSAYKNIPLKAISETFNVQFRAELFNVLNHANFAPPINNVAILQTAPNLQDGTQTSAYVGGTGLIDRTTSTSRQIQFGLKVIW